VLRLRRSLSPRQAVSLLLLPVFLGRGSDCVPSRRAPRDRADQAVRLLMSAAALKPKPINYRYARLLERLEQALDAGKCGNISTFKHETERVLQDLRRWEFVEQARPR
jgi:hypothetical protein